MNLSFYQWLICQVWLTICDQVRQTYVYPDIQLPLVWHWAKRNAEDSHCKRAWAESRWATEHWEGFCRWREYDNDMSLQQGAA